LNGIIKEFVRNPEKIPMLPGITNHFGLDCFS
jgi:hypothetical protein